MTHRSEIESKGLAESSGHADMPAQDTVVLAGPEFGAAHHPSGTLHPTFVREMTFARRNEQTQIQHRVGRRGDGPVGELCLEEDTPCTDVPGHGP